MSVVANVAINVDSRGAVGQLKAVQTQAQLTERAFGGLQQAIGALGVGFALSKVISDVKELDTNLRRLTTVGVDVVKINPALSSLSKELGGVASKAELAAASYQAASAGFSDTAGNINILRAATKAATGGLADTSAVTEVLVKTLNAYGMSGNQAIQVTDSISKAVELGNQEWSDYTSQLGRVASIAALAGVSLDEVNAFIASATKNGATAEIAFTGLGATLNTLLQPTKESQEAAAKLGLQWNYGALQAKGFAGLMAELAVATEKDKEATARLLGSQEAMRGAMAASSKGGTDFKNILEQLGNAAGKTDADFQTMKGSLENTLKALDTSFKNLSEALGKAFGPTVVIVIRDITKAVNGFADFMSAVPQPVMDTTGTIIKLVAQMLLVQKGIQGIIALRAGVIGMLAATAGSAASAGTAAGAAATKVNMLKSAMLGLLKFAVVTLAVDIVISGLGKLAEVQARMNAITKGSTKQFAEQIGGSALSRQEIEKLKKENRAEQARRVQEKKDVKAPLVTAQDDIAQAAILELDMRYAQLQTMGEKAKFLTPADRALSDSKPITATGGAGDVLDPKAAKKAAKEAEKAAKLAQKLAEDSAQYQIQIDDQIFKNQVELDKMRYDLQRQLQEKQLSNWVNKFTGAAKEQAGIIQSMVMGSASFDAQIKEIENKIKEAQQRLQSGTRMNQVQSTTVAGGVGGGFLVGSTGKSSGPHLDLRGSDREGVIREAAAIIKVWQKQGLPYIELPNAKINVKNMLNELQLLQALRKEQMAHDVTRGRPVGGSGNAIDISVPAGTKVPVAAGTASFQGLAGYAATSLATGNRMLHGLPQSKAGGGGVAGGVPGENVDQTKAEIQGLIQQLALLKSQSKSLKAEDLAAGILASTSAFREQTAQLGLQSEALTLRNRLQMEGVKPELIEGELQVLAVNQRLRDATSALNMDNKDHVAIYNELNQTATTAATAIRAYAAATAAASSPIQQFIASAQTQLNDLESVAVRVSQGIGDAVGNSLTKGIQGLVEGTTTAQQVFADFLKSIGDILMQEGTKMIATYTAIAIAKSLAGLFGGGAAPAAAPSGTLPQTDMFKYVNLDGLRAAGGPVSGNSTYMVGEQGPELFVPRTAGTIVPAGPTAGIREAMANGNGQSNASPVLNMSFQTSTINGVEYVSRDQLEAAMMETRRQASRDGAKRGMTMTLDKLQQSPSTRSRVGLG